MEIITRKVNEHSKKICSHGKAIHEVTLGHNQQQKFAPYMGSQATCEVN
jgi:hypothetical protein